MRMLIALVLACAFIAPAAQAREEPVVAEARAFMEAYGRDLAAGDRAAIAARYDRTGAFFLVAGGRDFADHPQIVRDYAEDWRPPASFEWQDLHFDAVGPDAVVINGRFVWGAPKGPVTVTYTGFLRRQDGQLRIRLEDETPVPPPPAAKP